MLRSRRGKSAARKPLADIFNGGKSLKTRKKKIAGMGDDGAVDCLPLVRSELANLIGKIDEWVVQAVEHKTICKKGSQDMESFRHVLSDMHTSLKPWFSRFQQALAVIETTSENQLSKTLDTNSASGATGDGNALPSNKNESELDLVVSPSPLVSWRAGTCTVESGRQLFLLTPLPKPKTYSSNFLGSSTTVGGINANNDQYNHNELPPLLSNTNSACSNLRERVELKQAPSNAPKLTVIETKSSSLESVYVSLKFSNYKSRRNSCMLTPCLKTSPPKSCALLDPISEPFRLAEIPTQDSNDSKTADDLANEEVSDHLAPRYQELFGLHPALKVRRRRKEVDELDWFLSPPTTCVLMEPTDEKPLPTTRVNDDLLLGTPMLDFESTIWTEKQPGEATLKKELWTKFEAVSMNGLHFDASIFQKTSRNFLEMLEEASCETPGSDTRIAR